MRDGLATGLGHAQALVMSGQVVVGEHRCDKAGTRITDDVPVRLKGTRRFVSRAGDKLDGALTQLELSVDGLRCLDIGASTGGFTDCLLQRGAAAVHAVDVGYGLLEGGLRNDPRVSIAERCNARELTAEQLPFAPDLVTIDVSFIATAALLGALLPLVAGGGRVLAMVKPQFELPRHKVPNGGVVTDRADRALAADMVAEAAIALGWKELGRADSALAGPKGNVEVFLLLGEGP